MPYYKNKNNLNLFYEIFNGHHNGKTPILMLHGFGSSAGFFQEQLHVLKSKHKVVVFDAEGHGKSEKNPQEKLDTHLIRDSIVDIQELLYILRLDEPIVIIGHSLVGGGIAQQFALDFPEQVKSLILLNSGKFLIDNTIRNIFWNLLPQLVRMEFNELILDNIEILLDKTIPFIRGALMGDEDYTDFVYDRLDGMVETEIFDMIQHPLDPSKIRCPTLVIGAELDNYAPLWMSKDLAETIPDSRYSVVPMCGHFGPNHRPEEYNKLILDFLEEMNV
ncbi:MAG: alpha/beta hydrolase [Candidatus Lokiarchaeota archaeon]|nr:alpha/beta hydrolase [Candidatus Lokiarchaeota archaeon]